MEGDEDIDSQLQPLPDSDLSDPESTQQAGQQSMGDASQYASQAASQLASQSSNSQQLSQQEDLQRASQHASQSASQQVSSQPASNQPQSKQRASHNKNTRTTWNNLMEDSLVQGLYQAKKDGLDTDNGNFKLLEWNLAVTSVLAVTQQLITPDICQNRWRTVKKT